MILLFPTCRHGYILSKCLLLITLSFLTQLALFLYICILKHLCASISVGESVKDPLGYYENNVSGTITLLQVMQKYNAKVYKRIPSDLSKARHVLIHFHIVLRFLFYRSPVRIP